MIVIIILCLPGKSKSSLSSKFHLYLLQKLEEISNKAIASQFGHKRLNYSNDA